MSLASFLGLRMHYLSAHDITVPKSAKRPDLQPDPDNTDYFCQMCQKKYKNRVTFAAHLKVLHNIRCPYVDPPPVTIKSKDAAVLEDLSTKLLDSESAIVNSTDPNATPSLTPPSTVQSNTNLAATKKSKRKSATLASKKAPTSSKAETKTVISALKIQNDTSDFAVKFFIKDGQMNRTVSTRTPPPTLKPSELELQAIAPSPVIIAPQPTMQRDLVAPYPDLLDPNYYCRCCDKTFSKKDIYRKHCRVAHTLPLPDRNDSNFFCYVCNLKSPDLFTYQKHMSKIHLMKGFPAMFDIQCYHCDNTYADAKRYNAHLAKVAKKLERIQLVEKRPPLTWDEPSFHCSKCLKTFDDDQKYKAHLRSYHGMTAKKYHENIQNILMEGSHSNEVLDKKDAHQEHFFCFACRKDFFNKHEFHQHIKEAHKLNLSNACVENLKIASSPNMFPEPLDPTFYYSMMKGACQFGSK